MYKHHFSNIYLICPDDNDIVTVLYCKFVAKLVLSRLLDHIPVNVQVQRTSGVWLKTDIFPLGTVNITCNILDPSAFFINSTVTYSWTSGDIQGYFNTSINATNWIFQHKYITTGHYTIKINASATGPNSANYFGIASANITIYGNKSRECHVCHIFYQINLITFSLS